MSKDIRVNGCAYSVNAENVLALFAELKVDFAKKAVEVNGEILEPAAYATTAIHPHDQIEIIQFVGGG